MMSISKKMQENQKLIVADKGGWTPDPKDFYESKRAV